MTDQEKRDALRDTLWRSLLLVATHNPSNAVLVTSLRKEKFDEAFALVEQEAKLVA